MTALDTFAATLAPGGFSLYPAPSLNAAYDGVSKCFEPSAAAKADAQANAWTAVHMADWWSHLAHDADSDTYWIAGGRDRFKAIVQGLASYSATADAWTHVPAWSGQPGGHCYQSTAAGGGRVFYLPSVASSGIQVRDIATGAMLAPIPLPANSIVPGYSSAWASATALEFLPWLGAQGSLLWVNTNQSSTPSKRLSRIARYDFATAAWVSVFGGRDVWTNQHKIALKSKHAPIALVGSSTAADQRPLGILDATGTLTFLPAGPMNATPSGSNTSRGMVFEHPDRQEWVIACLGTQKFWSLPAGAPAWVDRGPLPSALVSPNTAALATSFGAAFVKYRSAGSEMYAWKPGF